jgi:hypothetical protein
VQAVSRFRFAAGFHQGFQTKPNLLRTLAYTRDGFSSDLFLSDLFLSLLGYSALFINCVLILDVLCERLFNIADRPWTV